MPGVPRREYRESWLGTTPADPKGAQAVGAQPRPPDANPPNGVGGVGADPEEARAGRANFVARFTGCWAGRLRCRVR